LIFLPTFNVIFIKHFYSSDIYCIVTTASIHLYHVRFSYVIKGFTYLLTYLQLLSAAVALSGHCSAAAAVHCWRREYTRCKNVLDDWGGDAYDETPDSTWVWIGFHIPHIAVLTNEPEMLQTMRFVSIQCSNMQLQPGLCAELRWSSGCTLYTQIL